MRSGLRLLVGYLCQVGGNSYLRCWPRNVVLSRATRAFSILLPLSLSPPRFFFFPPSNVCLLYVVSRANGDHVFTTRSMIVAMFGNCVQCRRIRIIVKGSIGFCPRYVRASIIIVSTRIRIVVILCNLCCKVI